MCYTVLYTLPAHNRIYVTDKKKPFRLNCHCGSSFLPGNVEKEEMQINNYNKPSRLQINHFSVKRSDFDIVNKYDASQDFVNILMCKRGNFLTHQFKMTYCIKKRITGSTRFSTDDVRYSSNFKSNLFKIFKSKFKLNRIKQVEPTRACHNLT